MSSRLAEITALIKEQDEKIAALRAQADALRAKEKQSVVDDMLLTIAEYGITAQDLKLKMPRSFDLKQGSAPRFPTLPPKYRGPNGETWSGRGRHPRWAVEAQAAGKSLDDFLIRG